MGFFGVGNRGEVMVKYGSIKNILQQYINNA